MGAAVVGLVKAVFAAEGIDPKLRRMIIPRAATVLNVPYEWQANVPMSLIDGPTQAEVDAAAADAAAEGIGPDDVLVCRATAELSKSGTLTDATLSALRDRFGDVIARKVVLTIARFNLLSRFPNGCQVPLETTDRIGDKKSPLGQGPDQGYCPWTPSQAIGVPRPRPWSGPGTTRSGRSRPTRRRAAGLLFRLHRKLRDAPRRPAR